MLTITNLDSKKIYFFILAITSLVYSKLVFFFINDPEGPNLLIVTGLAVVIYLLSLLAYFLLSFANPKRFLLAFFIQTIIAVSFYFLFTASIPQVQQVFSKNSAPSQENSASDSFYSIGIYPNSTGTVTKDVVADYGSVTTENINKAIDDARDHFKSRPDDMYIIKIPAGTFSTPGVISVSNIQPGPNGRLVIIGAGKEKTTLIQSADINGLHGINVFRTSFIGMHFALPANTTTQGHVIAVAPGKLTIQIPEGFPTPLDIFDPHYNLSEECPEEPDAAGGWGRYLRVFKDSKTDPEYIDTEQRHVPWCKPVAVPGEPLKWDLLTKRRSAIPEYPIGSLLAVKSKSARSAYQFNKGDDFEFRDILWTQRSRGTWQGGFNHVHIIGCSIVRPDPINGQAFVLSTAGGGPQIGDLKIHSFGHIVENNYFQATGDDVIALYNADTILRNNSIYNVGRLNIGEGSDVTMTDNTIVNTRVEHTTNDKSSDEEE